MAVALLWSIATPLAALFIFIINWIQIRLAFALKARRHCCKSPPPYPHKDPFLGIDLLWTQVKEHKAGYLSAGRRKRFSKLGKTYSANVWGTRTIYTMDLQNIREVLITSSEKFGVQPLRLAPSQPLIGPGIFTTDGPYWEHSRKLIRPIFQRPQITDFTALDVHIDRLMRRLPRDGSTIELQGLLKLMYLDHSTEMIFGESTDVLSDTASEKDGNKFLNTYNTALHRLSRRFIFGRFRLFYVWDKEFERLSSQVHTFLDRYIDAAIERQESSTCSKQRYIIIDELVRLTDNREEIRHQLLNIFLAAQDTTVNSLSVCLFYLARYPEFWDRLRIEVLSIDNPVTYDTLKSVSYLQAVINESLRLNPPVTTTLRYCSEDCVLPTGGGPDGNSPVFVAKCDQIDVVFGAMHYDKDIWGDDADTFNPERWLTSEQAGQSWKYIPFSAGRRICPGKELALTEIAYVLVRLVREFKTLENRDPVYEYVEESRLTTESRNGLLVSLVPADL